MPRQKMEEVVTLKDLAVELGIDRSTMRKYAIAQGVDFVQVRTPDSKHQLTLALTLEDADTIREVRRQRGFISTSGLVPIVNNGKGWFYVIQIMPDVIPQRVKLGFATTVEARLQTHRTASPTAELVRAWPCKQCWERAAMDSATRVDCKLIANEVYDCNNLEGLTNRCDSFFDLMPSP